MAARFALRRPAWLSRQLDRRLFRIRPAEPYPVRLGQRRIFVLPTRAGIGFGITLLAMLLASINYTLSLGFALTFLLAGLGMASMFHAFRNLLHLEIRAGHNAPAHAGEDAHFEVVLRDATNRTRPALTLRCGTDEATVDIPANGTCCSRLRVPARHRGWLPIGRLRIETTYPLGLIRAWSVLTPAQRTLVYPALDTAPPPPAGSGEEHGSAAAPPPGEEDFGGLREHQPADSPRRIAWKAVARTDTLLSKDFTGTEGATLSFDWHALPPRLDTETRLRWLTRWVVDAAHAGQRYRLILPERTFGPDHSAAHRDRCLEALALFGSDPSA
ncbi:DUF58 domain-containing protein [Nitrogeniibacter mangrovi]|uniref:DUF58 domain-containing protein n=1 Tax=Nitrogeniibacter mangrovi TaxID=2016596 RepID=A0A6C1B371_9RHOO|nr:DUF58 domain-containing protein [Nitrogeniibacter mangrovi]QID18102.1 DUF58 domain-containing protein [Nitrogeniibacter mangrovi]